MSHSRRSGHNFSNLGAPMERGSKQDPYLPTMIVFDLGRFVDNSQSKCLH